MATKIVTKNSSTASAVPTASDLVQGELAVNVADKRLFTEDNGGSIVELGTNPSTIDINAGSIDGTAIGASSASTGAFTTLTATGLTVDTDTLYVDSTNNRVGIGTSSPGRSLHVYESNTPTLATFQNDGGEALIRLQSANNSQGIIEFGDPQDGNQGRLVYNHSGSYMSMWTADSERMRINSSGNVGIGTSSPLKTLVVNENDSECVVLIDSSDTGTAGVYLGGQSDTIKAGIILNNSDNSLQLRGYNNAERMRINSSGNVGIGTTSPSEKLQVEGTVSATGIKIGANGTDINSTFLGASSLIAFKCNGTERMRIDSSGNLLVGTTSGGAKFRVSGSAVSGRVATIQGNTSGDLGNAALLVGKYDNNNSTSQVYVQFSMNNDSTASGQINANGASQVAFGSWSDRRLKENITDLTSQLENIKSLRPVEFDYIEAEGGGHQLGFIAQEVEEIYPDLVGERSDGMKTLSNLGKWEARLVKAIQEQQTLIESLTARIAALEE